MVSIAFPRKFNFDLQLLGFSYEVEKAVFSFPLLGIFHCVYDPSLLTPQDS